jgi:cobalt-zinc-cadmium efflux system outer membrane protein
MRSLSSIAPLAFLGLLISHSSLAETALARAFADAWQRQPAVAALFERERAAAAKIDASSAWTATPPSLELSLRSDRFNQRNGAQENEIGLVLPLWLPGERSGSQALAEAEGAALAGRGQALRLRLAQVLRETWWRWQSAQNEAVLAGERVSAARQLRDDVTRRFNAGDLSRADLNQAEGALAQAMGPTGRSCGNTTGRYLSSGKPDRPLGRNRECSAGAYPERGGQPAPCCAGASGSLGGGTTQRRSGAHPDSGESGNCCVDAA